MARYFRELRVSTIIETNKQPEAVGTNQKKIVF